MDHPRGKRVALAGLALAVLVLGAAGYLLRDRAVEEWYLWKLDHYERDQDATRAAERLADLGSPRAIIRFIDQKRGINRQSGLLDRLLQKAGRRAIPPLKEYLTRGSDIEYLNWYTRALDALVKLEPRSPEVLEACRRLLASEGVGVLRLEATLRAFEGAGGGTVPAAISLLRSADVGTRRFAIQYLAEIGPDASPAVPALVELLEEDPATFRAAMALVEIGVEQDRVVRRLIAKLSSDELMSPESALKVIERLGREAGVTAPLLVERLEGLNALAAMGEEAVPALNGALKKDDPKAKSFALEALARIGPKARASIPEVKPALDDPDPQVRQWAALALDSMDETGDPRILPVLINALHGKKGKAWVYAVQALQHQGPATRKYLPDFLEVIKKSVSQKRDDEVQLLIRTLGVIGPAMKDAVSFLGERLGDPQMAVSCCFSLLKMGPEAREVIPALEKLLRDGIELEPEVARAWAAGALIAIEPARSPEILPRILGFLRGGDQETRKKVPVVLRNLRELARPAVPELLEQALAGNVAAAQALEKIGIDESKVARIAEAVHDKDRREQAVEALFWIGPPAKAAIPALIHALEGPQHEVREAIHVQYPVSRDAPREAEKKPARQLAAEALGKLGPEAHDAIPALKALERDWNKNVRAAARDALAKIQAPADQR
jgi:HEAT repeat protein